MSAIKNKTNSPTLLCVGAKSDLSLGIAASFSDIGCSVNWMDFIQASKLNSDTSLLPNYVCIFAPEIPAKTQKKSQEIFKTINQSMQVFSSQSTKVTYISRHPDEYRGFNFSGQLSTHQLDNHADYLQKEIHSAKQSTLKINTIIVKDFIDSSPQDYPLAINQFFTSFSTKLKMPRVENHRFFPVLKSQVGGVVKKIIFSQPSTGRVFQIQSQKGISAINLVLKIKKSYENQTQESVSIEPTYKDYPQMKFGEKIVYPREVVNLDEIISENIRKNLLFLRKTQQLPKKAPHKPVVKKVKKRKIAQEKNSKIKKKQKNSKIQKKTIKKSIVGILIATLLLGVSTQVFYLLTLKQSVQAMQSGDMGRAVVKSKQLEKSHWIGKSIIFPMNIIFQKSANQEVRRGSQEIVEVIPLYIGLIQDLHDASILGDEIFEGILNSDKVDIFKKIDQLSPKLQAVYESISSMEIKLNSFQELNKNQKIHNTISQAIKKSGEVKNLINSAQKTLTISHELLGKNEKKTYAVLLQNNTELRPTGGFIGSFALISFEKGKMYDIETYDVYSADGQLRGHVEPPQEIKQYLGEANWYLRDSNFNPDFPTTARRVEWFLGKEINRNIDGVVGINLYVVKDLLDAVGGVEVSDYQETITGQNLFQRAQYKSELNYFTGSTQKKDFISSLINALYFKILDGEGGYKKQIMTALIKNAQTSQLQVSLRDREAEEFMQDTIFSGKIIDSACQPGKSQGCIKDYTNVIESNFGVNKVNFFIERSIDHQIDISATKITHQIDLNIQNTAQTAAWPAGSYKNYLRLYIPEEAVLKNAKIDNISVPIKNIRIVKENNKKSIGFLVTIPIAQQKNIHIEYDIAHNFTKDEGYDYQLYLQKQPGTSEDLVGISINNQLSTPQSVSLGQIEEGRVVISTTNTADQHIVVEY